MSCGSKAFRSGVAFGAAAMLLSSTAQAAPSAYGAVDPLISLSVFGTSSSRAAVCAAGASAAAMAGAAAATAAAVQAPPGTGCVLPVLDPMPPPMVQTPVGVAPMAAGPGLSALFPLLAVAALGGLAVLLLDGNDREGPPLSPA